MSKSKFTQLFHMEGRKRQSLHTGFGGREGRQSKKGESGGKKADCGGGEGRQTDSGASESH